MFTSDRKQKLAILAKRVAWLRRRDRLGYISEWRSKEVKVSIRQIRTEYFDLYRVDDEGEKS